ncbi:hypothetical protein BDY19DRAFT_967484 [Irpex rosettiformis]|uniref:Uncharacterized protein n=1 Tax=Irpex rosettiformis TaxID=378272 RepID=A0ACB8TTA0_9APHY|nr:hypothetical protein BDY19DRAFT_967484 [Irpex rosettiformis]
MSTPSYKHSLRRHVPSGHAHHSPTPSPPDTPMSGAASVHSHHSKREKVKETVDHLLHKFHIPHHHRHHEYEHGSLDTPLTPEAPGKKSFIIKRASFAGSLRAASIKRKSIVAAPEVASLAYKTSPASPFSSLDDDHSSSGASSSVGKEENIAGGLKDGGSPKGSKSPSRIPVLSHTTPTKARGNVVSSTASTPAKEIVATPAAVVQPTVDPVVKERHTHHSKREEIKEAVDHVFHKLHIPHHHHAHPKDDHSSSSIKSTTESPSSLGVTKVEDEIVPPVSATDVPVAAPASKEAVTPETNQEKPVKLPGATTVQVEQQAAIATLEERPETLNEVKEIETVQTEGGKESTTPVVIDEPANETKDIVNSTATTLAEAQLAKPKVSVESTTPTGDTLLQDNLHTANEHSLIPASQTKPTSSSYPSRKPILTPVTVPAYFELRKATESYRRSTKKPSWFRYIYGSFVRPIVVVTVECTVAVVCYGLAKVLESKPAASIAQNSEQLRMV